MLCIAQSHHIEGEGTIHSKDIVDFYIYGFYINYSGRQGKKLFLTKPVYCGSFPVDRGYWVDLII